MELEEIRNQLIPKLDSVFQKKCYELTYVSKFLPDKLLIFSKYCPTDERPCASFAFSLDEFENNKFPNRCWITSSSLKEINGVIPNGKQGKRYQEFTYNDESFIPYSVNLSEYKPTEAESVKTLLNSLYEHIEF